MHIGGREDPNPLLLSTTLQEPRFSTTDSASLPGLRARLGSTQLWFSRALFKSLGSTRLLSAFSKLLSQQPKPENTFIWIRVELEDSLTVWQVNQPEVVQKFQRGAHDHHYSQCMKPLRLSLRPHPRGTLSTNTKPSWHLKPGKSRFQASFPAVLSDWFISTSSSSQSLPPSLPSPPSSLHLSPS